MPALKLKPSRPDAFLARFDHLIDRHAGSAARLLGRMAWMHAAPRGRALFARYCSARTSFGRHEPPNAKPGFRYVRRHIQLVVAAEHLHHFVAVDPQPLAQVADLVREAHLERMPGVARVLASSRRPGCWC